VLHKKTAILT